MESIELIEFYLEPGQVKLEPAVQRIATENIRILTQDILREFDAKYIDRNETSSVKRIDQVIIKE